MYEKIKFVLIIAIMGVVVFMGYKMYIPSSPKTTVVNASKDDINTTTDTMQEVTPITQEDIDNLDYTCATQYNTEINEIYGKASRVSDKEEKNKILATLPTSSAIQNQKPEECNDTILTQINDGVYNSFNKEFLANNQVLLLVNPEDQVEVKINDKIYNLDKDTSYLSVRINTGDKIDVKSSSGDGIYLFEKVYSSIEENGGVTSYEVAG